MALVTIENNLSTSIESENLPTCLHANEITGYIDSLLSGNSINMEQLTIVFSIYLENPVLLDPFIGNWTQKLTSNLLYSNEYIKNTSCQILYQFCKIKGYKSIIKHFPNSVIELPKVFEETFEILKSNEEVHWMCRYIFMLWMSFLIQCPFDLKKIFRNWNLFSVEFMENMVRNRYLKGSGGRELHSASVLLASLFKRSEMNLALEKFLSWSGQNINNCTLGCLTTLSQLAKLADDDILLPHLDSFNEIISLIDPNSKTESSVYKMILKIEARLAQILIVKLGKSIQLNRFLSALAHRDTVIRWTTAKALRRILEVCDGGVKVQVSESLLSLLHVELNSKIEISPHTLHGFLLAIGQLLNYRLFLQDSKSSLSFTNLIIKCLKFDQIKGSYAVGSFVRDAACFVIWSLARYNDSLISSHDDHSIIAGLTCMALFDREVAGRRAASAALQEFIGRIGSNRQGDYLVILEHVHFFSVSALEKSFLVNAMEIARELTHLVPDVVEHLLKISIFNFDKNIRRLAGITLGNLFSIDSQNIIENLIVTFHKSDDLFAMHGSLLALASLPIDRFDSGILDISLQADRIPIKSLGADLLLDGHLKLINSIVIKSSDRASESILNCWLKTIVNGLKSRSEDLRNSSLEAVQSISTSYASFLDQFYLSSLSGIERERDSNYQKSLLASLGTCNSIFFSQNSNSIIKLLIKKAKTIAPINDIETRCIAIESLCRLLDRFETENVDLSSIKDCLISSLLCDYSIDARGDVGSKVRLAALNLSKFIPKCPEIDNLVLELAFGRLDRIRGPAMAFLFPSVHESRLDIDVFALELLSNYSSSDSLSGAFRGLIFSCGGLDPEITKKCSKLIIQFIAKWGCNEFENTALLALTSNDRLCIPVILTISHLLEELSSSFIEVFSANLIDSVILKTCNIRKLLPAFNLLIKINNHTGNLSEFLKIQENTHKYPAIRQLIESSLI